ncbi:MAG TPA: hypothetical protein VKF41_05545 [Bryobacteraceae bacterium]|nr:hypothetical protein [Bryobacteraceae bacterium]
MAGIPERLASARSAVAQSCHLLLNPTPEVLDRCFQVLSGVIGELAFTREEMAPFRGDSGVLAEVCEIRVKVRLAGRLLENAAAYHLKWSRILGAMLQGYTARGEPPTVERPGRLRVEG